MAGSSLAFIDELQGATYTSLSATDFAVGVVDPDDSGLTPTQIDSLQGAGKTLLAYLSVGEAETYRSYWQSNWNTSPPTFLLGADPDWPGSYNVKFWDPAWQQIVISQAVALAQTGYNGLMLDVVDAYAVASVAAADGGVDQARADMQQFVLSISAATKAVNPEFKIYDAATGAFRLYNPWGSAYSGSDPAVRFEASMYDLYNNHCDFYVAKGPALA